MLKIEMSRRPAAEWNALPAVTRVGVGVLVCAGALDVLLHVVVGSHAGHFGGEHLAHAFGIAGMVLVLAGVVTSGARRQFQRRARGR